MTFWVSQSQIPVHSLLVLCHLLCVVLSVIVTWYLGYDLAVKEKGKNPQFPPSFANQPINHPSADAQLNLKFQTLLCDLCS